MLRGAIIGFGKIAQTGHAPAYADSEIRAKIQIVAVAEPNPAYRAQAVATFETARVYETAGELVARESLDFVDICTPPHTHGDLVRVCAQKGIHILCEKPFVPDLNEARELAELLASNNRLVFMPCHQYRYSPVWRPFKDLVGASSKASRSFLQFTVCRTQADPGFLAENPNWRTDQKISGGGILADTGVHYLYLVPWILGHPRAVTTTTANLYHQNMPVEDTALVVIECERGIAQIALTWAADRRANSARLVNHEQSLVYDGTQLERGADGKVELLPVPDASDKSQYVKLYVSLIEEFARRVTNHHPDPEWVTEAYGSIELLQACYRSASEKRTVLLSESSQASIHQSGAAIPK